MQNITILGATGSIGDSTLQVIRLHENMQVHAVSGFGQIEKLAQICREFLPKFACVPHDKADELKQLIHDLPTQVVLGDEGLCFLASHEQTDKVVAAIVGAAGLSSTCAAVRAGKTVLLANKESLVMAGALVMRIAKAAGATILPIDSEHNAIFQCLPVAVQSDSSAIHHKNHGIKRLWLTASGGVFLHKSTQEMAKAGIQEAVNHPNWHMGQKISIDSSTMMNKGFEMIEACHLFDVPCDRVQVVIHPQSVVHSLVEYVDGSFLAQMGTPDMKTPIAYALSYPDRMASGVVPLDLFALRELTFLPPDTQKFGCLSLAYRAMQAGQAACIVLNASNEVAVEAFLQGRIRLTDIAMVIEKSLTACQHLTCDTDQASDEAALVAIFAVDTEARQVASSLIDELAIAKWEMR